MTQRVRQENNNNLYNKIFGTTKFAVYNKDHMLIEKRHVEVRSADAIVRFIVVTFIICNY
jgi:hypothetical protein